LEETTPKFSLLQPVPIVGSLPMNSNPSGDPILTAIVNVEEKAEIRSIKLQIDTHEVAAGTNNNIGINSITDPDGAKPHSHYLTQQWCRDNFPSFIGKDRWPPNSPDLSPLDYSIWDELVNTINWNKVQSKTTLVQQLKSSFKNIRESVVFESFASFTNRLYHLCQNDGNYLR
ncbi:unnamed protein product, partial [Rotaria socialis]